MNVVLCADRRYSMPCGVCLTSMFENNKDVELNAYILTNDLDIVDIEKFHDLGRRYSQKVFVVQVEDVYFEGLKTSERFSKAIYYRFLIPKILSKESCALYLDCDIIVNGSLKQLEAVQLESFACAVVRDQMSNDKRILKRLEIDTPYFNSGVLLMNLDYWRQNEISTKLVNFIHDNSDSCIFPDQDALNYLLSGEVVYLPLTYNFQELFYLHTDNLKGDKNLWDEIEKTKESPVIIHYTNSVKPWYMECTHPLQNAFEKYRAYSPWEGEMERYYTIGRRYRIMTKYLIRIKNKLRRICS